MWMMDSQDGYGYITKMMVDILMYRYGCQTLDIEYLILEYIGYTSTTFKYTDFYIFELVFQIAQGRLSLTARPFEHTESNLFTHTFRYMDGTGASYYLRNLSCPPSTYLNVVTVEYGLRAKRNMGVT